MFFIVLTVVAGVLMYLFVQRVVVMKPVGMKGVDDAIDQLVERQRLKHEREMWRKRRDRARSWESTTLSEHTMEMIDSLTATTCPEEVKTQPTTTPRPWSVVASTAVSMSSETASAARRVQTPEEFDKTFDPKEAVARKEGEEGGEKKHHRHHHKRHHRHRSRAEEKDRERSEDSVEGDDDKKSKGGHKRHRRHRSREAAPQPRLDTPLLVAGETLPGPDAVDVEVRGSQETVKNS